MIVEFAPVKSEQPINEDPLSKITPNILVDGDVPPPDTTVSDPLEMWLNY